MKPFNAVCSRKLTSLTQRQWKLLVAWRRQTGIPSPLRAQRQYSENSMASPGKAKIPRYVIDAIELATVPVRASSRRQHVTHVEKRATLLQPADQRTRVRRSHPSKVFQLGSSTELIKLAPRRPRKRRTPAAMSTSCTSWVRNHPIPSKCHS